MTWPFSRIQNIEGQRFHKLVAQWPVGRSTKDGTKWLCLCDCGGYTVAAVPVLRSGGKRNCGCVRLGFTSPDGHRTEKTDYPMKCAYEPCQNDVVMNPRSAYFKKFCSRRCLAAQCRDIHRKDLNVQCRL